MFVTNDKTVICSKGKMYEVFEPTDFESTSGICLWVKGELEENVPLTNKYFEKYFSTIDEMRDNKINQILK